jgi:hypothetical protein
MALAGETIIAAKVPGERIATAIETANSGNVTTTETVIMTVVAPVVISRIYRVTFWGLIDTSVANDRVRVRIREDSVTGNTLQISSNVLTDAVIAEASPTEAEYTADATEDKTFVATLLRVSGSGNEILAAASTNPAYLYVDYIRG